MNREPHPRKRRVDGGAGISIFNSTPNPDPDRNPTPTHRRSRSPALPLLPSRHGIAVRYTLPQPYQDLSHTADLGVSVEGTTPEEALSRLVLALGGVLAGSGAVEPVREKTFAVPVRGDLARAAVNLLRELLFHFATERVIPCACEVLRLDGETVEARVEFGRWDPDRNADGADVKAVTYHAARLEPAGAGWRAQVLFDV